VHNRKNLKRILKLWTSKRDAIHVFPNGLEVYAIMDDCRKRDGAAEIGFLTLLAKSAVLY
jgi:hypothetical protein